MKALIGLTVLLFAAGCASMSNTTDTMQSGNTGDSVRYECYTYVGSNLVLTLPIAPLNSAIALVDVTFHGEQLEAVYLRDGLTQIWTFEQGLYVQLDPDLSAKYMDFRGADEGERRSPESVFKCRKRR